MARDAPTLIACEDCGSLNEGASQLLAQAQDDIANLEKELRIKRSQLTKLQSDRWEKLRTGKRYESALAVLKHWSKTCAPRAREIDSVDRLEVVIARLNGGYTVEQLKLCAEGYATRPYVVSGQGRVGTGTPAQRKVEATLIFGDPKHVDAGLALAATPTLADGVFDGRIERLSWRRVQSANRSLIVRALEHKFGKAYDDGNGYLRSPCPKCDNDPAMTLTVYPTGMGRLVDCSVCGIDETRLIAAITEEDSELRTQGAGAGG